MIFYATKDGSLINLSLAMSVEWRKKVTTTGEAWEIVAHYTTLNGYKVYRLGEYPDERAARIEMVRLRRTLSLDSNFTVVVTGYDDKFQAKESAEEWDAAQGDATTPGTEEETGQG